MHIDALLSRLKRVKRTGSDRWMACCPAHEDRTPSLSIRETEDGRILLFDFGGCDVQAIVAAVGLELGALFPERDKFPHQKGQRSRIYPHEVFDLIRFEVSVVYLIGSDMHRSREISEKDYERLGVAIQRLEGIAEVVYERPR